MSNDRQVFAALRTGSQLYGTARSGSDQDWFNLVYPTRAELVANRQVTIPQQVGEGWDIRSVILGDFVMSLGHDVERTLSALHYPEVFEDLQDAFMCSYFLERILNQARSMHNAATNDKQSAHAYRLWYAYVKLHNSDEPLYPMTDQEREIYLAVRDGAPVRVDWMPTIRINKYRHGIPDTDRLADWVWAEYQEAL